MRQLTNNVNGQICAKCGKRTARHLPRIAGPWLGATFDNDRAAAKAAVDALDLVFPSPEKVYGVRKTFQKSILEHCRDAILHETVSTLSDERTVSAEDAQATYARVLTSSLAVVGSLLRELQPMELDKERSIYEELFADPKLWELANHSDPGVRRSMHRLVQTCLDKQRSLIKENEKAVSSSYVYKGLQSDQTGSALDFVQTLEGLTTHVPTIWTDAYSGKRSASSRLRHFLKQGSQSSSIEFWNVLSTLLRRLPSQVLPTSEEEITDLTSAARHGVSQKEERFHASTAWSTYFVLVNMLTLSVAEGAAETLLQAQVMPLIRQYLYPATETSGWSITSSKPASVVCRAATIKALAPLLQQEWPLLGDKLVEIAKMSQPEQSKDFDKSQEHVAAAGERWAGLQREFWDGNYDFPDTLRQVFTAVNLKVMNECSSLLKARNGKPYGAAAIIDQLLRRCATHLTQDDTFRSHYTTFVTDDVPNMAFTPSLGHLVHGLYVAGLESALLEPFVGILCRILLASESTDVKASALQKIFTHDMPPEALHAARNMEELQTLCKEISTTKETSSLELLATLIKLHVVPAETVDTVLSRLTASLDIADERMASLSAIELLCGTDESAVKEFMASPAGAGDQLLPSVLRLEQSHDDAVAERASNLSSKLSSAIGAAESDTKFGMVLQNLDRASKTSLPIDAVHDLVERILGTEQSVSKPLDLLPSLEKWKSALVATVQSLRPSLALLSPLGGAVQLVHAASEGPGQEIQYDAEGLSQGLRISMFVSRLLAKPGFLQKLGEDEASVIALLQLSVLIAEDNISIAGANALWQVQNGQESEAAALEFTAEANKVLADFWLTLPFGRDSSSVGGLSQYASALEQLRDGHDNLSPVAYYTWLASAQTYSNLFVMHPYPSAEIQKAEFVLRAQRSRGHVLAIASCISGFQQPLSGTQTVHRFCNELVADLTDIGLTGNESRALEQLVLLNSILRNHEDSVASIAKQRLIFLVKHILPWLDPNTSLPLKAEVCKTLTELLPGMQDMYGEHWEQSIAWLTTYWSQGSQSIESEAMYEDHILVLNASLRLFATLKKISTLDTSNDDLVDALKDKQNQLRDGLLNELVSANGISDETHQPLMITHEVLARQIMSLPEGAVEEFGELYPLLYTPSRPIQEAAFNLLHKEIPVAQEQISFDAALENKTAQLPEELLSLVLESPTLDTLADASFDRMMPLSLQGYLYSWRLLFDHFSRSSYRVKSDYIEQFKDGTYLTGLLSLTFDFLGHTRGRPVDVSKFDIQEYIAGTEPNPEKDVQWLLTHLIYLALTYLPSLVKSYYLDIRSRQTSLAIETWTAKHISPLIITSSLEGVAEWAKKSVKEDPEYEKMTVKVGMRSKEINVSYVVDEQTMAIKVVLPEAYPLDSAKVVGVSRVAVKEEKWQSWLRNCQGVITFSVSVFR